MPNYDWREYRGRVWTERFPNWSRGFETWRGQASMERIPAAPFEERRQPRVPLACPCIFAFPRQIDVDPPTLRIAYLACDGLDYRLDILGPALAQLPGIFLIRKHALPSGS